MAYPGPTEIQQSPSRPWLFAGAVALLVAVYTAVPAWKQATTSSAGTWHDVFQDSGVTYFVADRLNGGARLYADVAYPYGPASVWAWAAVAEAGGNVPSTYAAFTWAGTVAFVILLYAAVARAAGRSAAFVLCGCGLPLWGTTPYHPFERCLFAAVLLAWAPPAKRSFRRALVVGGLLGCWQWVKFGGAVYAAAALVIVDIALLIASRADRVSVRRWLATTAAAAAFAGLVEAGRVEWAYGTLPSEVAADVIWPAYTGQLYQTFQERYPGWYGWRYFVLRYLIPASGVAATPVAAALILSRSRWSDPGFQQSPALLVPPLFFLLGVGTYLGHLYVYMMYMWCLMPPTAVLIGRWPRASTVVFLGLWLPGTAFQLREAVAPRRPSILETLPRDHPVAWDPEHQEAYRAIVVEWNRWSGDPAARPLLMPIGSGYYFLHHSTPPSRHTWLLPHYFRPYDERPFLDALDHIPFLVYTGAEHIPEDADLTRLLGPTFGTAVTAAIQSRVQEEVRVNAVCRIYRLRQLPVLRD